MKRSLAIATVGIRQMFADPMYVIFLLALPVMMTWIMSFLPKEAGVYEMASLGVLVMFVALNLINSAGTLIEEKQKGTWARLLASPAGFAEIMGGYFIKLFIMAWMQTAILILSGKYLFGAPWNGGFLEVCLVMSVYIFAMTGLGLFLAGILKTPGQVQAVSMTLVMVGTMLGDIFFPIENPSWIIQTISSVSPQSWAAHALKDIFTAGSSTSFTEPLLWMGGIGLALLVTGTFKLRFDN